jgi:hypothetical protein
VTGQAASPPRTELATTGGQAADAPIEFRVISGNPTASELAAVTAVLTATIENLEDDQRQADEEHGPTGWQRTQRPIRTPIVHGTGSWRTFSG